MKASTNVIHNNVLHRVRHQKSGERTAVNQSHSVMTSPINTRWRSHVTVHSRPLSRPAASQWASTISLTSQLFSSNTLPMMKTFLTNQTWRLSWTTYPFIRHLTSRDNSTIRLWPMATRRLKVTCLLNVLSARWRHPIRWLTAVSHTSCIVLWHKPTIWIRVNQTPKPRLQLPARQSVAVGVFCCQILANLFLQQTDSCHSMRQQHSSVAMTTQTLGLLMTACQRQCSTSPMTSINISTQ